MQELFEETLSVLDSAFSELEDSVPSPQFVSGPGGHVYRYVEKSVQQAIVLKLARVVSGLRAALVLLENGFVQEQGVLQRVLDEINEDIVFLAFALIRSEMTEWHQRYVAAFFEEEFNESGDPLTSPQKREMIPRRRIRAYLSRVDDNIKNPSDQIDVSRSLSKAYSGYVHGAAPHIFELYGGSPPMFHLSGMLGTPRIDEHERDLLNYFFRGILSFIGAAKAFGDKGLTEGLFHFRGRFESAAGMKFQEQPKS